MNIRDTNALVREILDEYKNAELLVTYTRGLAQRALPLIATAESSARKHGVEDFDPLRLDISQAIVGIKLIRRAAVAIEEELERRGLRLDPELDTPIGYTPAMVGG